MTTSRVPILSFDSSGTSEVVVDLDRVVSSRMLIQANSGGGKSWALRYVIEQTHGRIQQLILDPEGEFASLREHFPYVLIGSEGDLPIDVERVALLCRRLLELDVSAVIDIYELRPDERRRFVRQFLEALVRMPRALWRPLMVVLDEAHQFAPERGTGEAESTNAVIDLCTLGRKRGFMPVLATQRIAKLHKDAAAELLNVLVGRTGLDVDVRRAGDILGFDKEQRQALKTLEPGTFFAFGPAISRDVVPIRTGNVVTSHPAPGKVSPPAPPAPDDLAHVLAQLQTLELHPASDHLDWEAAQQRIQALERQLQRRQASAAPIIHRIEVPVIEPEQLVEARALAATLAETGTQLLARAEQLTAAIGQAERLAATGPSIDVQKLPASSRSKRRAADHSSAATRDVDITRLARSPLGRAERAALTVLAQHDRPLAKVQLAILAGYAINGGGYRNALGALRSKGLIEGRDTLVLTPAGRDAVGTGETLPTGTALIDYWLGKLGKAERAILQALLDAGERSLRKEEIAVRTGYAADGGGFRNALGRLRTLELIEGQQDIRVHPTLLDAVMRTAPPQSPALAR